MTETERWCLRRCGRGARIGWLHTVRAWTPTDLTSQDCAQMRRKIKRSHPRMPFRDRMLRNWLATRAGLTESIEDRYYRPNRPGFIRGIPI